MYRKTNKAKRHDSSCRNNGSCSYCRSNRTHANRRRDVSACEAVREASMAIDKTGPMR